MFTAPSVNDLGGHLKVIIMLMSIFDQRAKVIDEFSGSVVSDVRGAGERLMVYRPAGGDRSGQAGRSRAFALLKISVNPWNIWRTGARGKPRSR